MMAKFVEIEFGSLKVKFFPLSVGQVQEQEEGLQAMMGVSKGDNPFDPVRFSKLVKVYTASASRGDPNITEKIIRDIVDLGNIAAVNRAVLGQTGDVSKAATEGAPSDSPTSPQIGGTSTPA